MVLSRLLGDTAMSEKIALETLEFDPMDFAATKETDSNKLALLLRNDPHNYMALAQAYAELGQYQEAVNILQKYVKNNENPYAMAYYMLADCLSNLNDPSAEDIRKKAAQTDSSYCFPNMLEEYLILNRAVKANPKDSNAYYYIGLFLYDKRRYSDAKTAWETSAELNPNFPTVHRNLALYHTNKMNDYAKARKSLEKAFELNKNDARVFYELCELHKKIGTPFAEVVKLMEAHKNLIDIRDDLTVIYAEVLNGLGKHNQVVDLLMNRTFHPWEGGEGKIPTQHIEARLGIARKLIAEGQHAKAVEHLEKATVYFPNFGEGKLTGAQENNIYYTMGLTYKKLDPQKAKECFKKASVGLSEPAGTMYYNDQPPHMIYYQGAALAALGDEEAARACFYKLISYGEKHIFEKQIMDYFAVSLPDFLVFETDLDEKNKIHCNYMMGLGYLGLGEKVKAKEYFEAVLELAPWHYGALSHSGMM